MFFWETRKIITSKQARLRYPGSDFRPQKKKKWSLITITKKVELLNSLYQLQDVTSSFVMFWPSVMQKTMALQRSTAEMLKLDWIDTQTERFICENDRRNRFKRWVCTNKPCPLCHIPVTLSTFVSHVFVLVNMWVQKDCDKSVWIKLWITFPLIIFAMNLLHHFPMAPNDWLSDWFVCVCVLIV